MYVEINQTILFKEKGLCSNFLYYIQEWYL